MVLFTTSSCPSWPCTRPVENVHATLRFLTFAVVICARGLYRVPWRSRAGRVHSPAGLAGSFARAGAAPVRAACVAAAVGPRPAGVAVPTARAVGRACVSCPHPMRAAAASRADSTANGTALVAMVPITAYLVFPDVEPRRDACLPPPA